jgi:flagellar biosynthesis protein FlhF
MNVKRFTARTSREAMALAKQAFGEDTVIISTKPCPDGVELLAMAPESVAQLERVVDVGMAAPAVPARLSERPSLQQPQPRGAGSALSRAAHAVQGLASRVAARDNERIEPKFSAAAATPESVNSVTDDVRQLAMSTLSFQDYVRERMLKKREAEMQAEAAAARAKATASARPPEPGPLAARMAQASESNATRTPASSTPTRREPPVLQDEVRRAPAEPVAAPTVYSEIHVPSLADSQQSRHDQSDMLSELREVKGLIEERFGALAFMEKLQREPARARLTQKLLDCGFSPALIRKLAESLHGDVADETTWAASVLERNLNTAESEPALEDQGGVYALIGSTGVGKTTSTAKIAAAFATQHGASQLGLITLDAYRVAAHEQLRAYGRILGVPVHTAHDRASLEDLLDLLSGKKMVLIDTAGMAQRDARTKELLDMLSHRSINKLLVVNAAAQGETIEDVLLSYRAHKAKGVVLSKIDEAVKLGPALDAVIRHKLKILGVANGQRVPEDWHRLSSHALVQKALRVSGGSAYRMDSSDVNLVFSAPQSHLRSGQSAQRAERI